MSPATDSAGVPFEGRSFRPHPFAGDDGSAPAELARALADYHRQPTEETYSAVVEALRPARVLVPLLSEAGERAVKQDNRGFEKSQELSVVTVAGPSGDPMGVAFSSAEVMAQWKADARPVPAAFQRVAAWALTEGVSRVVLDPTGQGEVVLRRSALTAIVRGETFVAPWKQPEVEGEIRRGVEGSPATSVEVSRGSLPGGLSGPDLLVTVSLPPGLSRSALEKWEGEWATAWSRSALVAREVDGIFLKLVGSDSGD